MHGSHASNGGLLDVLRNIERTPCSFDSSLESVSNAQSYRVILKVRLRMSKRSLYAVVKLVTD